MQLHCVVTHGLRAGRSPLVSVSNGQRRAFNVAVIGGGVTGLTAAWRLAKNPRCSNIVLYEKSPRLGGWLESETIPVDEGEVVFDYGPRTVRASPTSVPLTFMAMDLGIAGDIKATDRRSPAALNRFLYYPDHLVSMPSPAGGFRNFWNFSKAMVMEPVFESLYTSIWSEPFKPPLNSRNDESVASFISRRFHPKIAENLVSAFCHGIYAGDIDQLSAETLFGRTRALERHNRGVILGQLMKMLAGRRTVSMDDLIAQHIISDLDLRAVPDETRQSVQSVCEAKEMFTFRKGLAQLVDGLAASLMKSGKVKVMTSTEITSMKRSSDSSTIEIASNKHGHKTYHRVIAATPAPALTQILTSTNYSNHLIPSSTISQLRQHDYATTVMVVNLYYPNPNLLPVRGFGYLIPRSVPFEQNPERGLGVIFASESSMGQDTAPGTKLTVMLGGYYWDGWQESDYPDHESAVRMARTMLQRHLGITDAPTVARSRLQRNALPQPTVGHRDRMMRLSESVRTEFDHRLTLAGNWYGGPGVPNCVNQGILAATLGVGQDRLDRHEEPWLSRCQDWDLEGGIPTSPVPYVDYKVVLRLKRRRKEE